MADASPESIPRLIENSEKGLAQIEMSSPILLEGRKAIEDAINKQEERNAVLYLLLLVYDTLLAENEVIYDLSASLDPLLKATDDYAKRYYMQSLNLCFWEAFVQNNSGILSSHFYRFEDVEYNLFNTPNDDVINYKAKTAQEFINNNWKPLFFLKHKD